MFPKSSDRTLNLTGVLVVKVVNLYDDSGKW